MKPGSSPSLGATPDIGPVLPFSDIAARHVVGGLDRSEAMMSKRVGNWAWALTGDERIAAAVVGRSQSEKTPISAKLKRKYDAMLEKQRKLTAH
jgi:hypothetical protein